MRFDTAGWDQQTYTAEVIVRDEVTGQNSALSTDEFDVVAPLDETEVTLEGVETHAPLTTGEPAQYSLELRNTSRRDSSIVSTASVRYENGDWQALQGDSGFRVNLPAHSTRTWRSSDATFESPGEHEIRLDDVDVSWSFTVTE